MTQGEDKERKKTTLSWGQLILMSADDEESAYRQRAQAKLGAVFPSVPDKKQAWSDLIRLTQDMEYGDIRRGGAIALGHAFAHVPNKKQAWQDLHRLAQSEDDSVREGAAEALGIAFSHVPDKKQAWDDLHRLTSDTYSYVRLDAASALGSAFSHVPDKEQAWDDLIRLISDNDSGVRWCAADAIGSAFVLVPDKSAAWSDLMGLASSYPRRPYPDAAFLNQLMERSEEHGGYSPSFSDIERAEREEEVYLKAADTRASAYYSMGKVLIYRAAYSEKEEDFKNEMENAIGFFEKASEEASYDNPTKFCLPFYRSFYTMTFKKEEAEAEVQKYLSEAKTAIEGSESKEKLVEAVENLGNALKEAQKVRDFNALKSDLNAYRRYCDRACELLDTMEEKAPGASRLIRRGLPIIDERIKGVIAEIQEKAKALCKQVKDTEFKEIGQQVNNVGQELSKVIDPIRLDKEVSHMLIPLKAMCKKMPEEDRGEACEILKQINDEQNVEDKLPLISMFLSKISTQMSKEPIIGNIHIENSEGVQVIVGTGNKQVQDSNSSLK